MKLLNETNNNQINKIIKTILLQKKSFYQPQFLKIHKKGGIVSSIDTRKKLIHVLPFISDPCVERSKTAKIKSLKISSIAVRINWNKLKKESFMYMLHNSKFL